MLSAPGRAFASWTAARSVHCPASVAHAPSPGLASTASAVLSTVKLAAMVPLALKATEARASKSRLGIGCPPVRRRSGNQRQPVLPRVLEPKAAESRATAVLDHRSRAPVSPPSGIRAGQHARPRRIVAEGPDPEPEAPIVQVAEVGSRVGAGVCDVLRRDDQPAAIRSDVGVDGELRPGERSADEPAPFTQRAIAVVGVVRLDDQQHALEGLEGAA